MGMQVGIRPLVIISPTIPLPHHHLPPTIYLPIILVGMHKGTSGPLNGVHDVACKDASC